jgi:hypothetical protein
MVVKVIVNFILADATPEQTQMLSFAGSLFKQDLQVLSMITYDYLYALHIFYSPI